MNLLNNRKFVKGVLIVLAAAVIFVGGFLVGHGQLKLEQGYKPVLINRSIGKPKDVDFALFWQVWNKIVTEYPGDIKQQDLVYGAIKGLVAAVGDQYSTFMTPEETKTFLNDLKGELSGIGAEMGMKNNQLTIVAPLASSPAEKAGIKSGDIIEKIDGTPAGNFSIDEAINKIRGRAGTEVTLTITRSGEFKSRDFKIRREQIQVPSAEMSMKGDIAYIRLIQFSDETAGLVKGFIAKAKENHARGIIIDVRDNPGGLLDSAVEISNFFLPKGQIIVREEFKGGRKDEYKASVEPITDLPLKILVNGGSASAAEILAGAIKDNNRGSIIGEKTFGKGTVQDFEQFDDNSSLKLTVAHWLTPGGINIGKTGIEPNIVVKLTEADINADRDPQLERSLRELK